MNRIRVINQAVEKLEFTVAAMIEKYGEPVPIQPVPAQENNQIEPNSNQVYSSTPARPQSTIVSASPRASYTDPANIQRSSFKNFVEFGRSRSQNQNENIARPQV